MRGAPGEENKRTEKTRIIPAYAGSTMGYADLGSLGEDHPRVCGEHGLNATSGPPLEGSSPRMRGALQCGALSGSGARIIPAYAGSTYDTQLNLQIG